jgi:hypothetical protein
MKPLLALLAILLAGCASSTIETYAPRAKPVEPPQEILIETSPPGAIVDWNGNVLGASPVTVVIRPDLTVSGRPRWPETGAWTHYFRARWPNGASAVEMFCPDEIPPQRIAIICPGARNLYQSQNKTITQKKSR